MIEVKPMQGVQPMTRRPQGEVPDIDGVYRDGVRIGLAHKAKGGAVSILTIISESLEDEIRQALDKRDGDTFPARMIQLHPKDPRKGKNNVDTRPAGSV